MPSREVPLEILVLGFCRTGTASMRSALAMLGYGNAHHIGRVMNNPREIDLWSAAIDDKYIRKECLKLEKLDELLGQSRVVADVPGLLFAQELIESYPDARVILTLRDPEQWFTSLQATLIPMLAPSPFSFFTRIAYILDPWGLGTFVPFARRTLEIILGPLHSIDAVAAKEKFVAYNDTIRRLVPPERLLEYRVGVDNWAPLCEFLGKSTPNVAFPHRNDTKSIMDGSRKQIWGIYQRWALQLVAPTIALLIALGLLALKP
ncbi:hypothetical protein MIND_00625600 [Mycena indigotica]|uniref:NAD dependent epimerase/dehydratase n=1 Tax=Mycena indigotica TaxID=2126181 RepID=A0A8H6SR94_9AGAR|nr:uncharacterized protein MIND_00625600 [Mycena indigotica]KAF7303949.1 hypothetical protein MIND_00625600 [Mycena indigotica]